MTPTVNLNMNRQANLKSTLPASSQPYEPVGDSLNPYLADIFAEKVTPDITRKAAPKATPRSTPGTE